MKIVSPCCVLLLLLSACGGRTSGAGGPDAGAGVTSSTPSCAPGGPGMTNCGPGGAEDCCTSLPVQGGTYARTYTNTGSGPTGEADPATVSSFRLDKYEVTVGRFRQFVKAWNGGSGYTPQAGSGKHSHLNGGMGLASAGAPGSFEPGWAASDDANIDPSDVNLADAVCDPEQSDSTWTPAPGSHENLPMNCVTWYEAYAFCIWDGAFLPSEAEWEYAAAGGSQELEYPWGSGALGSANAYAIYDCLFPTGVNAYCPDGVGNIAPVGTPTAGAGVWGQVDLLGNVLEWNLDTYAPYVSPCLDCANLDALSDRVDRGGFFGAFDSSLGSSIRDHDLPSGQGAGRDIVHGLRCARTP